MKSLREINRRYKRILHLYKDDKPLDVNCYKCNECGSITKTVDVDAGVTPMYLRCENYDEYAVSTFYKDIAEDQEPTIQWKRPTIDELHKARRKDQYLLEHILNGGLIPYKISEL